MTKKVVKGSAAIISILAVLIAGYLWFAFHFESERYEEGDGGYDNTASPYMSATTTFD